VSVSVDGDRVRHRGRPLDRAAARAVGQDDVGVDIDVCFGRERRLELRLGRHHDRTGRLGQPNERGAGDRRGSDKWDSAATKHGGTLSASVYVDPGR
jgi:hypothetical protein